MIDDDAWPPLPQTWQAPARPRLPTPVDEIATASPPAFGIDFDVGRSPYHWPYWPEPWKHGFLANVDEGAGLRLGAFGADGAATFILSLEPGAKVTYAWSTSIVKSYSGKEQRESPFGQPRQRFEGTAFLLDGADRDIRGALVRAAASGSTFLLALPYEELSIASDSVGATVAVSSTARCDWALPGQRVAVVGVDGSTVTAVVQTSTSTTIVLDVAPGTVGRSGGRIMPLLQVLLDPQQGFSRYPVNVDMWSVRAQASVFGYAGVDSMGIGTSITTYTAGAPVAVADLTDDDLLIWDRTNEIDGQINESMMSLSELVDLGALPFGIGGASVPDWGRSVKLRSSRIDDWQWLKAFLRRVRGRQMAFLLPTGRPDLVFDSYVTGGFKVKSSSISGAGDYVSWFAGLASRRLAVSTADGVAHYVEVASVVDNHDGTLTLTLTIDSTVSGAVSKISFLEQVRFDRDEIEVTWDGWIFSLDEVVRVTQEAISVPSRLVFDAVIETGILTIPGTVKELGGIMGRTTLFNFQSDRTISVSGIAAVGGNVDGMVACLSCINNASFGMIALHEDSGSNASNRMRNSGLAAVGTSNVALWYRYNGSTQRWIQFWSS